MKPLDKKILHVSDKGGDKGEVLNMILKNKSKLLVSGLAFIVCGTIGFLFCFIIKFFTGKK